MINTLLLNVFCSAPSLSTVTWLVRVPAVIGLILKVKVNFFLRFSGPTKQLSERPDVPQKRGTRVNITSPESRVVTTTLLTDVFDLPDPSLVMRGKDQ